MFEAQLRVVEGVSEKKVPAGSGLQELQDIVRWKQSLLRWIRSGRLRTMNDQQIRQNPIDAISRIPEQLQTLRTLTASASRRNFTSESFVSSRDDVCPVKIGDEHRVASKITVFNVTPSAAT